MCWVGRVRRNLAWSGTQKDGQSTLLSDPIPANTVSARSTCVPWPRGCGGGGQRDPQTAGHF